MKKIYGYSNGHILGAMNQLLLSDRLVFEGEHVQEQLLIIKEEWHGDISDHLIAFVAAGSGCTKTMTFNRKAASSIPGMERLT